MAGRLVLRQIDRFKRLGYCCALTGGVHHGDKEKEC